MNIIVSVNNAYIDPLKVLIKSMTLCESDYLYFYLLQTETITPENINALKSVLGTYGEINIIDVPVIECNTRFSAASLSRIIAPFFLPDTVHIALYLDADVIVCGSLVELYNTSVAEKTIAAVPDLELDKEGEYHFAKLNIVRPQRYVNSGVLLINIDRYKERYNLQEISSKLTDYKPISSFIDQDFINDYFRNDIKHINIKYNHPAVWRSKEVPLIVHFMGEKKPWNKDYNLKYFFKYRKFWNSVVVDKPLSCFTYFRNLFLKLIEYVVHK